VSGIPPAPARERDESLLVYGPDVRLDAAFALALARRRYMAIAWADCARPGRRAIAEALAWVERRLGPPVVGLVDPPLLRPANFDRAVVLHVLAPARAGEERRLLNHLAMPEVFQRLAARAISPDAHGAVLLLHVDNLPEALRPGVLDTARLHETLHEEGLSFLATSQTAPTEATAQAFDTVVRLEPGDSASWASAVLVAQRGNGFGTGKGPAPLPGVWEHLGLDPSLYTPT